MWKKQVSIIISLTFTNMSDKQVRWPSAFSLSFPQWQCTEHAIHGKLIMTVVWWYIRQFRDHTVVCNHLLPFISHCRLVRSHPLRWPLLNLKYALLRTSRHVRAYDTGGKFMSQIYSFILSTVYHLYNHINRLYILWGRVTNYYIFSGDVTHSGQSMGKNHFTKVWKV